MAVAVLALAGCGGSNSYGGGSSAAVGSSSSSASSAGVSKAVLSTASSPLGTVVVDKSGRTVYVFAKDTPGSGKSACSGDCSAKWPAVTADSDTPAVNGVTGTVATITREDGTKQVTLGGMPLYAWSGDSHPGDVTGQGFGGLWWVVRPDGTKITATAPASSSAPASTGGY